MSLLRLFCMLSVLFILFLTTQEVRAEGGASKRKVRPYLYGNVVMATTSAKAGVQSVSFDHWNHRQNFTCRVCHVDIGFGMNVGDTQVSAADNERGTFCGSCHNGVSSFAGKVVFASCKSQEKPLKIPCTRCHREAASREEEDKFVEFSANYPRQRLGNGIDWEKAEETGKIKLIDTIEKVPVKQREFASRSDLDLTAKTEGMPEIIFSHKKHTVWCGCESCHPDIFIGVRKGMTNYSMVELFNGRYCGVCHGKVAFPTSDCQRCHTKSTGGSQ